MLILTRAASLRQTFLKGWTVKPSLKVRPCHRMGKRHRRPLEETASPFFNTRLAAIWGKP